MIVPSRRWFFVAAALGVAALLALVWPGGAAVLVAVDVLWVGALVADALRARRFDWKALEVAREAPPAFSVGRPLPVSYRWTQRSARPITVRIRESFPSRLRLDAPDERQLVLVPGETMRERWLAHPTHRGRERAGTLHLRLQSPWGLAWRQTRLELPWEVLVYPNLTEAALRALPSQLQRRREAGQRNVRRIGEGRVFESLREWVPGDDTRTVDWKATAKRGKVMARQYEDERRQQVLIVIDAGRMLTAESDGVPRLESVVDAALQLAYSAVAHDDNVGLLVFADEVQQYVPPARGRRALREVLDALATVEGKLVEPNYPAAFAYMAARNRKRALTVLFTDVIDRTASDALLAQAGSLRPRHLPVAVTLRDPQLERMATQRPHEVRDAFDRAAAEELLLAREEALADMRARGVIVLDVAPSNAARAVVEQYTWLKRRAVL